jgi:hypothetical protein
MHTYVNEILYREVRQQAYGTEVLRLGRFIKIHESFVRLLDGLARALREDGFAKAASLESAEVFFLSEAGAYK